MARRAFSGLAAAVLATAGLVFMPGAPAQAGTDTIGLPVTWAFTDVRSPHGTFIDQPGDAPVGAWSDENGRYHSSRSYFTFDISGYRGMIIQQANFRSNAETVHDCGLSAPIELWVTGDITSTTSWLNPPAQQQLVAARDVGTAPYCGVTDFTAGFTQILQEAVNGGKTRITMGLRTAGVKEFDPRLERWFTSSRIAVRANTPPPVPSALSPCGPQDNAPYVTGTVRFRGTAIDPDARPGFPEPEQTTVAVWPSSDPSQREEIASPVWGGGDGIHELNWDHHGKADGQYSWTMKASDGFHSSQWSPVCHFNLDQVVPAAAIVSSLDYPADGQSHGGQGVPGRFTFTPNGSTDTAKYRWTLNNSAVPQEAVSVAPGEPVTVEIASLQISNSLYVHSIDRAGNVSDVTVYRFEVNRTAPSISVEIGGVGLPSTLTMSPGVPGVVEYAYSVGDGAETRVAAVQDGSATAQIVFPHREYNNVTVRSWTASGLAGVGVQQVYVSDGPRISYQDGVITFRPGRPDVASYQYAVNQGEIRTVQADSHGVATVPFTPATSGWYTVDASSVSPNGETSLISWHGFNVDTGLRAAPSISSSLYGTSPEPEGGPGIPGTFTFFSGYFGETVDFVVVINGGPEIIVQSSPDGQGELVWAPEQSGPHTLVVRSRFDTGSPSEAATFTFDVA